MEQRNGYKEGLHEPDAPLTAQEIAGELMEDGAQAMQGDMLEEAQALEDGIREGIGMLFEDGWSAEELTALSQDEGVRQDVAGGMDLIRAAAKMLRRQMQEMATPPRRRGVPVMRASAAGAPMQMNRIDAMSDAQFDAFSRNARAAAMMGKKVKM